jgi:uncharacterized membrane protein
MRSQGKPLAAPAAAMGLAATAVVLAWRAVQQLF